MLQDIGNRKYNPDFIPERKAKDEDYIMVFRGPKLLMKVRPEIDLPRVSELCVDREKLIYLFSIDEQGFVLLMNKDAESITENDEFMFHNLHSEVEFEIPDWRYFGCTTALHFAYFYEHNKFCGVCGKPMVHHENERSMVCPDCGNIRYHDMSVAVIVGVRNGNKLLLTQYAGSRTGHYALVAGFMEPGETLEDTVRREVMEETGVKVKNIRYVGSQPWGYSRNILVGFYADLDGDDTIIRQESELATADWYDREDIPLRENLMSLTATMMQTFKQNKDEDAIATSIYDAKPEFQV
ncbi:MAG: NAD(+) diphosphatase [Clostridia bacterium]|nr:NAD(+) diphosphatase [Clostridia bacterium]